LRGECGNINLSTKNWLLWKKLEKL
jgi:hypothetical protein